MCMHAHKHYTWGKVGKGLEHTHTIPVSGLPKNRMGKGLEPTGRARAHTPRQAIPVSELPRGRVGRGLEPGESPGQHVAA